MLLLEFKEGKFTSIELNQRPVSHVVVRILVPSSESTRFAQNIH